MLRRPEWLNRALQALRTDLAEAQGAPVVDKALPREWVGRIAYVVSMVGSPPVLAIAAIALAAAALASPGVWVWALTYVSVAIMIPVTYIVWQVHQGRLSDLDIQLRQQRARPLILSIACSGLAWAIMALSAAPAELAILAGALFLQMIVVLGITLRWKISMHSTAAAGAATLAWSLVGTPLPLLIGVPLIAWSRVRLRRHTLGQTVAGVALGVGVAGGALWLLARAHGV